MKMDVQPWELHPPVILPELIRQLRACYPAEGEALEVWLRLINALATFYTQEVPNLLAEIERLQAAHP